MAQEHVRRHGGNDDEDETTEPESSGQERREKLDSDTGEVLDEIDDVLEDNAEDFIRAYVQKGGQ
ncbi:MAG: ubiquitin-like protein Pup [Pseudonocardiaceae bacterium]|nr:ubiquitin-like protein Pup [Pseudonocardiaceae bacterium]